MLLNPPRQKLPRQKLTRPIPEPTRTPRIRPWPDDDEPDRSERDILGARETTTERTCIVTRQAMPPEAMIRFVAAPDGTAAPDLRHRLPGRGAWVTATREMVEKAVRGRRLQKALELAGPVDPALSGRIDELLHDAAIAALSMSRRAGVAIAGFVKVADALGHGAAVAVLHAADGGEDGLGKIVAAVRRSPRAGVRLMRELDSEHLGLAFGRTHVIHAALLSGRASENVLARIEALVRYRGRVSSVAGGNHPNQEAGSVHNASPGHTNDA